MSQTSEERRTVEDAPAVEWEDDVPYAPSEEILAASRAERVRWKSLHERLAR